MPYKVADALKKELVAIEDRNELIEIGWWPLSPSIALGWGVAFKSREEFYWAPIWISIVARREEDKKQRDARQEYQQLLHDKEGRLALLVGELLKDSPSLVSIDIPRALVEFYKPCIKAAIALENRSF